MISYFLIHSFSKKVLYDIKKVDSMDKFPRNGRIIHMKSDDQPLICIAEENIEKEKSTNYTERFLKHLDHKIISLQNTAFQSGINENNTYNNIFFGNHSNVKYQNGKIIASSIGDVCYNGNHYSLNILFSCDASLKKDTYSVMTIYNTTLCNYTALAYTSLLCHAGNAGIKNHAKIRCIEKFKYDSFFNETKNL